MSSVQTFQKKDLETVDADLVSGNVNPRDTKRALARDIVSIYHNEVLAIQAQENFDNLFISKKVPDDIPNVSLSAGTKLIEIMVSNKMVTSNGEAKRMIKQGAVKIDDEKISDPFITIEPGNESILKVGKRRFLKIK